MPPKRRGRPPKGPKPVKTRNVEVSYETLMENGASKDIVKVVIRLPPHILGAMEGHHRTPAGNATNASRESTSGTTDSIEDTDFSDELSSLDLELNKALLSSTTTVGQHHGSDHTQADKPPVDPSYYQAPFQAPFQAAPIQTPAYTPPSGAPGGGVRVKEEPRSAGAAASTPPAPGQRKPATPSTPQVEYRTIPTNLTEIIKKELTNDEEDVGMIEKMIFTLKDPLSATKISLPVKSTICMHFECFDFENFCTFSHIPEGIKYVCRKDLVKRNFEMKKFEKQKSEILSKLQSQPKSAHEQRQLDMQLKRIQSQIMIPAYTAKFNPSFKFAPPKYPTYKCPICDQFFSLNQLYISDAYNFFVKTTPREVNRVELVDMVKYRILDDRQSSMGATHGNGAGSGAGGEEVIILSDEDEDEEDAHQPRRENDSSTSQANGASAVQQAPVQNKQPSDELSEGASEGASDQLFEDWLEDELANLAPKGAGSWEDPVMLD